MQATREINGHPTPYGDRFQGILVMKLTLQAHKNWKHCGWKVFCFWTSLGNRSTHNHDSRSLRENMRLPYEETCKWWDFWVVLSRFGCDGCYKDGPWLPWSGIWEIERCTFSTVHSPLTWINFQTTIWLLVCLTISGWVPLNRLGKTLGQTNDFKNHQAVHSWTRHWWNFHFQVYQSGHLAFLLLKKMCTAVCIVCPSVRWYRTSITMVELLVALIAQLIRSSCYCCSFCFWLSMIPNHQSSWIGLFVNSYPTGVKELVMNPCWPMLPVMNHC